ncbi:MULTISPECIES: transketolase [Bacillus]|jgi:transketolase|uniref:Transketolase n=2 Tax=Bacillus TaxID=1386 RepID=A0A653RHV3_BACAB|nr:MULTISPECIES: transketolase [Bacillus]OQP19859.1 transketolase [Bacillus stratosphericus]KIL24923.1 Transketolase [Bacillus altitudinis]KQU14866.1 transketolase [Bacillus sp. Leaf49]MCA0118982.1 transketolase [Bacillus sp. RSS_NA_20]MCL6798629.1 transketolase [Bacillus altitudinis]
METIELKSIATIRTLSIDAIEKANSGHPGMPMGAAPMAYALWTNHLNVSPQNPNWFNRDRFVLSAGHGSMLLYSMLHLSGYNLSIEDLKQFRQWGSKTPGHPEFGHTEGVDATTGPLGQGIAMAVGMALAERHLAETYNKDNFNVVDHYTYSICGDGDLMEGISSEAASLAGHLGLGRLIVLYDSNDISLDGDLDRSFSENVKNRFEAMNWEVLYVKDGNNIDEVTAAIEKAKQSTDKPTLIEVKTTIGFGSPNRAGTSGVHGAPLGSEEAKLTKEAYSWTFEEDFHVPSEVYDHFKTAVKDAGQKKEAAWNELFEQYEKEYPELAAQLKLAIEGKLPENWDQEVPVYEAGSSLASRASSGEVLNGIAKQVPFFIGGSADLAGSNKTTIKDTTDFGRENYAGRNIWFGVREFAMGAALNGMALHGGLRVFGGTFFVFSDYLRPAIRLAALMGLPVTYVFTHDSIAVGEDGPTHEPVEQLASLRAMPNLSVIRPADGNETAAAWKIAVSSTNKPTALVLTRQNLPTIDQAPEKAYEGVEKGGYVVVEAADAQPEALLLASGSEVGLAIEAQKALEKEGIRVSVVSLPAWDRFDEQSDEYKESVLPKAVRARVAIEMGASLGWERYTGLDGDVIAIDKFGASAPGETIIEKYGFTVSNVVSRVKAKLNK